MSDSQINASGTSIPTPDSYQNLESQSIKEAYEAAYEAEITARKIEQRINFIDGLRAMADFLEQHPQVEVPYSVCGSVYAEDAEQARAMTHLSGHWSKSYSDYNVSYTKRFTEGSQYIGSVRLEVLVQREQVCERVQVGTKHIEAQVIEAHDEPIYEWICSDTEE